jgi:hypothetical protein
MGAEPHDRIVGLLDDDGIVDADVEEASDLDRGETAWVHGSILA